ncbi:MAG: DUF4331 domain-containing protein [Nitrospirae bacterium]|nr:DUF4331 domain-containing protein [Candidatus Manganitrophaceae bacterium]
MKQKLILSLAGVLMASSVFAASHREAPLISMDPEADITDFYMFRSWENPDKVVFVMNVIPLQEPSAGPNYFNFADDVLYEIHIDNNKNNIAANTVYQIRFKTEIRTAGETFPLSYAALPPITTLDGAGSDGLILRQFYTVTEKRFGLPDRQLGKVAMVAVPSNVGPRTMPNYEDLAKQGIYSLSNGGRVFAGQRGESFYIDLGGAFDTLNLHVSPILSAADDADDTKNVGTATNTLSGYNVSTIALEIPINEIVKKGDSKVIGAYASTSRPRVSVIRKANKRENSATFVQVARMGNPLVNELIIATIDKDRWNATDAESEAQFLDYYCNSSLATALNLVFGTHFPTQNRADLANLLLRYSDSPLQNICGVESQGIKAQAVSDGRLADFIRLDLNVPPTDPNAQKRLGPFAHDASGKATPDPAAWPNGRRPNDDVTDIALRAVAGALIDPATPMLGDGVNFNIGAEGSNLTANGIATKFPFLPTPHNGRDRRHIDPTETP